MMFSREAIIDKLKAQIRVNRHILGVAAGAGISAKYAVKGGADLILALNAGRFRQMGLSSLACMLPFANCNEMVMEFGTREILPIVPETPVVFGLCATDPTINLPAYIEQIQLHGFSGINNFPSVGLLDGRFREALEENGFSFAREVAAIRLAAERNLFTIAFAFDAEQAAAMIEAGADVLCAHLGFTTGGILGAKKALSLEASAQKARQMFAVVDQLRPSAIKVIYGGPVSTPLDVQYMYDNTSACGYLGGSTFERIPAETALSQVTSEFKRIGSTATDPLLARMLDGVNKHYNYVEFVKEYIANNYMNEIVLADLALVAHISRTYLSYLFKKEVGCSFSEYLIQYRMNRALELLKAQPHLQLAKVAELVGYGDYAHFSKSFKRFTGKYPQEWRESYKNT